MTFKKLATVFVYVTQLERSIEFYEQLGLICRGIENWESGERGAVLLFPDQQATHIFLWEKEVVDSNGRPLFNVQFDGIKGWHEKLKGNGFRIGEINQWESEWHNHLDFDVIDPDGNVFNLIEVNEK